jgi:hypothetical protein
MTSAAFKRFPGSSTHIPGNAVRPFPLLQHPADYAIITSQQPLTLFNSSIWATPVAPEGSPAGGSGLANLPRSWPLLPADASAGSHSSIDSPRAHYPNATTITDTIVNVLMLLGDNSAHHTSAHALDSDSDISGDDPSLSVDGVSAALHCSASSGCPPNVPMRRAPPVMLLPAGELPGLALA